MSFTARLHFFKGCFLQFPGVLPYKSDCLHFTLSLAQPLEKPYPLWHTFDPQNRTLSGTLPENPTLSATEIGQNGTLAVLAYAYCRQWECPTRGFQSCYSASPNGWHSFWNLCECHSILKRNCCHCHLLRIIVIFSFHSMTREKKSPLPHSLLVTCLCDNTEWSLGSTLTGIQTRLSDQKMQNTDCLMRLQYKGPSKLVKVYQASFKITQKK